MKYIAVTEVSTREVYVEPKEFTTEEFKKALSDLQFMPIDLGQQSNNLKQFTTLELSQETFDFINSVATISFPLFGEKEYKINDLSFKIYPKEEYEKMFGKDRN